MMPPRLLPPPLDLRRDLRRAALGARGADTRMIGAGALTILVTDVLRVAVRRRLAAMLGGFLSPLG